MKVTVQTVDKPSAGPKLTVVSVSGPVDPNAAVVQNARRLVEKTGSAEMLASFDAAIASEAMIRAK